MIQINNEEIIIRPSAIDGFFGCAYQWGKTFLEGVNTIPNSRAAIGTSIHAGVEQLWTESIESGKKAPNLGAMTDAAMEAWKEETHDGVSYADNEDEGSCQVEIIKGTEAFIDDIVPFTQIPDAVEQRYTVDLDHKLVKGLSGTVDYIGHGIIADVKTSKRKPSPASYTTQQSIYKYLAEANGVEVNDNLIQGVVLTKSPYGTILPMEPNVEQAKSLVNSMLDTLDVVMLDVAPIETILRGNPKHVFCSPKYCALYNDCPFVQGKA